MPAAMGDKPRRSSVVKVLGAIGQTTGATAAGGSLKVLDIWSTGRDRAQYRAAWRIGTRCRIVGRLEPVAR
jgi:hypothetical protein